MWSFGCELTKGVVRIFCLFVCGGSTLLLYVYASRGCCCSGLCEVCGCQFGQSPAAGPDSNSDRDGTCQRRLCESVRGLVRKYVLDAVTVVVDLYFDTALVLIASISTLGG